MSKNAKKRGSLQSSKKLPRAPMFKTMLTGLLRFFEEELPLSQYRGTGKYETEVVDVKRYQLALETIAEGRSIKPRKIATFAVISPEPRSDAMRVTISNKVVGKLKPADTKFLQNQLEEAALGRCALKVPALLEGGRKKKTGEEELFTVRLSLPSKPKKKHASFLEEEA